jgi:hypothetical protein
MKKMLPVMAGMFVAAAMFAACASGTKQKTAAPAEAGARKTEWHQAEGQKTVVVEHQKAAVPAHAGALKVEVKKADGPKAGDAPKADGGHSEVHGGPKDVVGAEHKVLEGMIANFTCVSKGFDQATGQPTVTKGTVAREMTFGGRFLRETGNEVGAKTNSYTTTIGYNVGGAKWELTYISTEMTGMAYMAGTHDAKANLFTFKGDFNGMAMKYTIAVAANGDETHKLFGMIVMGPPGTPATEQEFFSTAYTREVMKMPSVDEMNKAWMEYGMPSPEHKRLTDMCGKFDLVMDCPGMGDAMPASKWTGTSEITKDESGMFVTEHMVLSTPATDKIPEGANKMDMTLVFSYHGGHKRYEVFLRMAQASGMQMMSGVWDKEKKAMVLEGMMWEPSMGKDILQKVEATELKDGKSTVSIFCAMGPGEWMKVGTTTYTKK